MFLFEGVLFSVILRMYKLSGKGLEGKHQSKSVYLHLQWGVMCRFTGKCDLSFARKAVPCSEKKHIRTVKPHFASFQSLFDCWCCNSELNKRRTTGYEIVSFLCLHILHRMSGDYQLNKNRENLLNKIKKN